MRRMKLWSVVGFLSAAFMTATDCPGGDKTKQISAGKEVRIEGELTAADALDKVTRAPYKVHPLKAEAGKTYKIEMHNGGGLDPFLRLEDAKGKQIAMNDEGAGAPNARILFRAPADGEYRIIATAVPDGDDRPVGKYTLRIEPIHWKNYLAVLLKPLRDKGTDASADDAYHAAEIAMDLEDGSRELAAEVYARAGKIASRASDTDAATIGRMMEGSVRRMELLGQPITVHGRTVEGKEFDWTKYKGKVVLIDFWATWCGPCRAEIPNVKRLYNAYHDRGFDVVAVSTDKRKDAPAKFMEVNKLPWVCLFDQSPGKELPPLAEYYGVFGIPQAILVDRQGRVVSLSARGEELEELLKEHIGPFEKGGKGDKENK